MKGFGQYVINNPEDFEYFSKDVKRQITRAAINTVNIEAAYARKNLVSKTQNTFILRNKFTTSKKALSFEQMKFQKVRTLNEVQSRVGFSEDADYMKRQDEGGLHRPKSGSKLAIPTDRARSGGSKNRLVAKKYRVNNLKSEKVNKKNFTRKTKRGVITLNIKSPKVRQILRAAEVAKRGKLMQYGGNLHRVDPFRIKRGNINFRLRQVYSYSKTQTRTKPTGFFLPECERPMQAMQGIFNSEMDKAFGK